MAATRLEGLRHFSVQMICHDVRQLSSFVLFCINKWQDVFCKMYFHSVAKSEFFLCPDSFCVPCIVCMQSDLVLLTKLLNCNHVRSFVPRNVTTLWDLSYQVSTICILPPSLFIMCPWLAIYIAACIFGFHPDRQNQCQLDFCTMKVCKHARVGFFKFWKLEMSMCFFVVVVSLGLVENALSSQCYYFPLFITVYLVLFFGSYGRCEAVLWTVIVRPWGHPWQQL